MGMVMLGKVQVQGTWIFPNVFVPSTLMATFRPWRVTVERLAAEFPHIPWLVTSTTLGRDGKPREKGGSHLPGYALDLAPMFSKTQVMKPDGSSPRLADNRAFLVAVAHASDAVPVGIAVEGDHLHLDRKLPVGCYAYSTYRQVYTNDAKGLANCHNPITNQLYKVEKDGTMDMMGEYRTRVPVTLPL